MFARASQGLFTDLCWCENQVENNPFCSAHLCASDTMNAEQERLCDEHVEKWDEEGQSMVFFRKNVSCISKTPPAKAWQLWAIHCRGSELQSRERCLGAVGLDQTPPLSPSSPQAITEMYFLTVLISAASSMEPTQEIKRNCAILQQNRCRVPSWPVCPTHHRASRKGRLVLRGEVSNTQTTDSTPSHAQLFGS